MYSRKAVIAIADGLGDLPNVELGGLTPLEKARTPNLDSIAAMGVCGIMDLISPGIPVGTDLGHLVLFGGNASDYPGRGPIEACGINMPIENGDVLFRSNFATITEAGLVADRRAGRINEFTEELAKSLNGMPLGNGVTAYFKAATEHRAVLILRGPQLGDKVCDTDPKHENLAPLVAKSLDGLEISEKTAALLNVFIEKSRAVLNSHPVNEQRKKKGLLPANFILTRGAGKFAPLPSIPDAMNFAGCCIAAEATVLGVARLTGYGTITRPAFTANIDTDIVQKAQETVSALGKNDLVFVHFKATDLAGHDNKPFEKVAAIERFDKMVGLIKRDLPHGTYLALAADHSTPCIVREHSGEPVPIAISGGPIRKDHVTVFDEISCATGGLGRITGAGFINTIFDYMGRSKKRGN